METPRSLKRAYVLDSSVIIKWFSEEEDTDIALTLREAHIEGTAIITVPDLVLYEVANALRYNENLQERDVIEAIESLIKLGIEVVVPTKEMIAEAVSLAFKQNITFYDACFVALAKILQFTCITADNDLYQKVKSLGRVCLLKEFSG